MICHGCGHPLGYHGPNGCGAFDVIKASRGLGGMCQCKQFVDGGPDDPESTHTTNQAPETTETP